MDRAAESLSLQQTTKFGDFEGDFEGDYDDYDDEVENFFPVVHERERVQQQGGAPTQVSQPTDLSSGALSAHRFEALFFSIYF